MVSRCGASMRVLILVEACGGVARHVTDLCAGLKSRGIDVHLLYSPVREDAVLRNGLERLAALAVPLKTIAMGPAPRLADLGAWCAIRQYIKDNGPFDIIHGHSSKAGALARLAVGGGRAVKVYTPHAFVTMNPDMGLPGRLLYRGLEHCLALLGDAVIATSPAELVHARSVLRIPEKKLFLVPNGIALPVGMPESARDELRKAWGVQDDEVVIGTVSRFVPQKDPELLIRAFARVAPGHRKARLVMVGDGPLRQQIEKAAEVHGISRAVVLPGYVDGGQAMVAFDIFALSSRYEGFPYVLLDALAVGLPIVTTAVGGAELAVAEGLNGFVVPVGGEREMADRLTRVVASPAERQRMGVISLARGRDFGAAGMTNDTVAVYASLLDRSRGQRIIPAS